MGKPKMENIPLKYVVCAQRLMSDSGGRTWNYPLFLTVSPFLGVIASGCTGIMKPPEQARHTTAALTELVPKYLDQSCYAVVNGAAEESTALLAQRWNHIFYTGGMRVGAIVAAAAARYLTPVTLELGGKCPVIVSKSADIPLAARRIAWGKFACAGQTCVAPDYALVQAEVYDEFLAAMKRTTLDFYGRDAAADGKMARMINQAAWDRSMDLLRRSNGKVQFGGVENASRQNLYIPPTVVSHLTLDDSLLSEELFAPVLPVVKIESLPEACEIIEKVFHDPLGLYIMSQDPSEYEFVLSHTRSGGVSLNDVMTQIAVPNLPFGGFGHSGWGNYHGKASIDTFSHRRSVVTVPKEAEEAFEWRYPSGDQRKKWRFYKSNLEAKL